MHFDVFNGDADGIIALLQLRWAFPRESNLITGVKRDIQLLQQVQINKARSVTALDISLDKNRETLNNLLEAGVRVDYVDHHYAGEIPQSELLAATIDTSPNTCTSLLINHLVHKRYLNWAIAAAFGDNLINVAIKLCLRAGLNPEQQQKLRQLGVFINYNSYGRDISDLHFNPADLYRALTAYENPFDLISQANSVFSRLKDAFEADRAMLKHCDRLYQSEKALVLALPDESWARRISGVYGNELAVQNPARAHAIFTTNDDGSFTVSVRAPVDKPIGAVDVCAQFETGGGRAGAAGINALPQSQVVRFIDVFRQSYCQ